MLPQRCFKMHATGQLVGAAGVSRTRASYQAWHVPSPANLTLSTVADVNRPYTPARIQAHTPLFPQGRHMMQSSKQAHIAQHNAAPDFSADSPLDGTVQVAPEFSLRLLDESYAADNAQIGKIQDLMVDYFKTRTSDLARGGLNALR